jgi:hypothetical protein
MPVPSFSIEERWTVAQLIGYLRTWSAYKRAAKDAHAARRLAALLQRARERFADHAPVDIRMPLTIVCGRVQQD